MREFHSGSVTLEAERRSPARARIALVRHIDCEAPVRHQDLAEIADHHVARLQVAVDDAAAVRERDCVADRLEHFEMTLESVVRARSRSASVFRMEQRVPGDAADQLHRERRAALLVEDQVVGRHDVRVIERAGDERLGRKRTRWSGRSLRSSAPS